MVFLLFTRFAFQMETFANVFETFLVFTVTHNKKCILYCDPTLTYNTGTEVSQALWYVGIYFFLEENAGHKQDHWLCDC